MIYRNTETVAWHLYTQIIRIRTKCASQFNEMFIFQGWWLVSNQSGHTGFTPATFLEPVEEKTNTGEEWHIVSGPDSMCSFELCLLLLLYFLVVSCAVCLS